MLAQKSVSGAASCPTLQEVVFFPAAFGVLARNRLAPSGPKEFPSQTGLTERAPQISFPETALGRKEPRVRQPCSVASVDDRVSTIVRFDLAQGPC